jgi:flagellar biosynthesis/type III secretory pathway protein FliH
MDITLLFDPDEELDAAVTPTPLADPVFTAIFQNAEVSGLAMKSLLNATLEDSGDKPVGEVISVTPQSVHSETSPRGFRIDVEARMVGGEIAIVEVQLKAFASTIERTLLYAEQALASLAKRGEKLQEVTYTMPRVLVVNILEKALREKGGFHQVVELLYRELPYERATDKLQIHNLELSKYRLLKNEKPINSLHNWLTAICKSQDTKKSLAEVVTMDEQLKSFYDDDPGFAQFVERHGFVVSSPEVRKAYRRWEYDMIVDNLEEERKAEKLAAQLAESEARGRAEAEAEGEARGEVKGETKGEAKTKAAIAKNMLEIGYSIEDISTIIGMTREEVESSRRYLR